MPKITLGITGLLEILGRDYGIEKPYWGPSFHGVTKIIPDIACVAGVERGRRRGNLGARESVWGAPHVLARAQIPPSPFNAGHAGYTG